MNGQEIRIMISSNPIATSVVLNHKKTRASYEKLGLNDPMGI
jgi:hypothetical protein